MNRYLLNERGYTMQAREVIETIFPGKGYGTRVPSNVSGMTVVDGVALAYLTTEQAKAQWGGKRGMFMRAVARCPDCQRLLAASRINQHAVVHQRAKTNLICR